MVSLSSLAQGAKSKISSAKNKVATEASLFKEALTTTDKAIDKVTPIVEPQLKTNPIVDAPKEEIVRQFDGAFVPKSQARNKYGGLIYGGTISAAPSRLESFESELSRNPVTGSRETGGYLDKVVTMGYNAPSALSTLLTRDIPVNTFFGGLDVKKAAGAAGTVLGGIPAAIPQAGIGLAESSEGVKEAKGVKDTAIKVTSVPVKTLMPFMNLIPGVMGFQFGTQATGLDEQTNKGVASAKGGLSDAFQKTGILNKEQADEFGSNVIDMFQLGLSLFGGAKSNQIGGKQKISDIAKEKSVQAQIKGIESQARQTGLSKADAKQFALESSPMVRKNTPTTLMSDAQVLSTNLKNAGIDIGANSLIPVLGLAYDNYKKSGNEDILGSIKEAAIQVGAMAIPGAKIKKTKSTPSPDQMSFQEQADSVFKSADTVEEAGFPTKSPTPEAPVAKAEVNVEVPVVKEKGPLETAMDNVARYEDYVAGITKSGRMPNGKKATKKDLEFIRSEYKRLVDIRNNVGKTPETELVELGGGKGALVRDKVYALPEPRITDAKRAEWAQKEAQFRKDYEAGKISKEAAEEYFRLEKEYQDKLKQDEIDIRNFDFETKKQNLIEQQKAGKISKEAAEKRLVAEQEYFDFMDRMAKDFNNTNRRQEISSIESQGYKGVDIPAYLRDDYTKVEDVDQPIQIALDRALLGLPPEKTNDKQKPKQTLSEIQKEAEQSLPKVEETTPPLDTTPKTPTLANTLDNILDSFSFGDDVFVSKSSNMFNKIGTGGGIIEKGMKNIKGQIVNLRNISQSARNSASLFANKILENFNIDKRNEKFDSEFKVKEEDILGGITPNEGTVISGKGAKLVMKIMEDIIPNSMKNFVAGTKEELNNLANLARAEYVYYVNRDNKAKLDTLFTPEQQKKFEDKIALSLNMPQQLASYLVEKGLISSEQLAQDYVRFVISQEGRDKFSNPVPIKVGDETYNFQSVEDAFTSIAARRASGQNGLADGMERALSSLMKEKAVGIDIFRVHSPTLQILSYAQNVGKFLQNKATLDNYKVFSEQDSNTKKFLAQIFPEGGKGSEYLEQIIGVNRKTNSAMGKIQSGLGTITRLVSKYILAGNTTTFAQAVLTAMPRGIALVAKTAVKNPSNLMNLVKYNELRQPQVLEILGANGFLPEHMPFDTSEKLITSEKVPDWIKKPVNGADELLGTLAVEFSGRLPEQASKRAYIISEMFNVLKKNGVTVENKPLDIAKAWEEWSRKPENKDTYIIEQDRIQENLSWMGESTIFTKSANDTIRRTNWQALTGFVNGQVNKAMTDFGRAIGKIEASTDQRKDAVGRLAFSLAHWGVAVAGAMAYFKADDEEVDDELAFNLGIQYANRMVGNPLQMFYSITSGITSSPVTVAGDIALQSAKLGAGFLTGEEGNEVRVQKLIDTLIKNQGGLKLVNAKGTLSELAADATGTFSTKNMTKTGKASGRNNEDSYLEAIMGMDKDSYVLNYMYGKLNNVQMEEKVKAMNIPEVTKPVVASTLGLMKSYRDALIRPIEDFTKAMSDSDIDYGEQKRIADVYNKIKPEDTLGSYMGKIGITDGNLQDVLYSEIVRTLTTISGQNPDAARLIQDEGTTKEWREEFGKQMEKNRIENPKLHNQIVSGFARIVAENDKRMNNGQQPLSYNPRDIAFIKSKMGTESKMQDDAIISAITGDDANSTALSQAITNYYQELVSGATTSEDIENGIKVMNNIFSGVYDRNPFASGIERSLALASIGFINKLKEEGKYEGIQKVWALMNGTPFVKKAIENGLMYRGWTSFNNQPTTGQTTSTPSTTSTSVTSSFRSGSGGGATAATAATTTSDSVTPTTDQIDGYKLEKAATVGGPQKYTLTELLKQQKSGTMKTVPKKQTLTDLRLKTKL